MEYLTWLYAFEWVQTKSPAGAIQWIPAAGQAANLVPDAHLPNKRHAPIMFTTDLALKEDPIYREITTRFLNNPEQFEQAFAKAWFKLTHRDMGPKARYVGKDVPAGDLIWQDAIPTLDHPVINQQEIAQLKNAILQTGLTVPELVRTAWASASTYRDTDMRGGANGARIRLEPQVSWPVNNPKELKAVLAKLEKVQQRFNQSLQGGKKVSLADVIVLAGGAAVEKAAKDAGYNLTVPFTPGRMDASAAQTDVQSFAVLEPKADAFRNYFHGDLAGQTSPAQALVDKARLLGLTVPEMTVLVGGMRVLDANVGGNKQGVLTTKAGVLSNDFFVNLLDMSTQWKKAKTVGVYEGYDRASGKLQWTASPADLIFGSNSELRAVAEVYAANDGKEKFVQDFAKAWYKVMMLDRFDR